MTGLLIDEGTGPHLCATMLDSRPPQCGDSSLAVEGVVVADQPGAETQSGVSWVDQATLTGEVDDETLRVSDTSL